MALKPLMCSCALVCLFAAAQAPQQPDEQGAPSFREKVHLVIVPAIVRDGKGNPVGDLTRDDFQIFDEGKRQRISQFSLEKHIEETGAPQRGGLQPRSEAAQTQRPRAQRFVAYLFDDVHLNDGDLKWVRDGVDRRIASMDPEERAAILTTSGQTWLGFTGDRAKLHETLLKLRVNSLVTPAMGKCAPMGQLMAQRIWEFRETTGKELLDAAIGETVICMGLANTVTNSQGMQVPDSQAITIAKSYVESKARQAIVSGDHRAQIASVALKQVVRRMGSMPGQRTVVFLSPGFQTQANQPNLDEAIQLAARLNVIVSSLDSRGLAVEVADEEPGTVISTSRYHDLKTEMDRLQVLEDRIALDRLAIGTGGSFIERTNDIDNGLKQITRPPEYLYTLAFSPENLVPDGKFHKLRVRLARKGYTVQARDGYFATRDLTDPAEAARSELRDAVFAPEDIRDPAVTMNTEFMKSGAVAKLSVLTRFDLNRVTLEKTGGRNSNDVTVVSCVFDQNGNFVTGKQQLVKLRLLDETLDAHLASGLTVQTDFDVPPGTYAVRVAVRDIEGRLLSAQSSVVEIP